MESQVVHSTVPHLSDPDEIWDRILKTTCEDQYRSVAKLLGMM